jgi:hypothetical protein
MIISIPEIEAILAIMTHPISTNHNKYFFSLSSTRPKESTKPLRAFTRFYTMNEQAHRPYHVLNPQNGVY